MSYSEVHDELRSVASDLLSKNDTDVDWPLLRQAGWIGLEVAEEFGGAGVTFAEVAIILEEMGRAATRSAYLGGAVLGVGTLAALQPSALRDALLADVASGAVRTAVVLDGIGLAANRLSGRAAFVPDAEGADRLLVIADDRDGVPVVVDADGLTVTAQPVLDETRNLAEVTAEDVAVKEIWRFAADPAEQVRHLHDRAAVAVACDSLGLAEAMLTATVDYAKVRQQFGRPIGSFQAVKHACADMLVQVSVARQLVDAAVEKLADGVDGRAAASMAKSYACAAAVDVAGKAMQLHGGIGYTWESGIHVYLKRALLNRSLFGSPAEHRRQLAKRYS
jgi:alkylation response protein AidB-like acyl-CoA dehydrogenase